MEFASIASLSSQKQSQEQQHQATCSPLQRFNFFSEDIDWDLINHDLESINWEHALSGEVDVDSNIEVFLNICLTILNI